MDILVATDDPQKVTSFFVSMPEVEEVLVTGDTKTSVRMKSGIEADLRVVTREEFPYALMYFTGSKEHNVRLRGIAKKKNWKLNEYGLFAGEKLVECASEGEIYRALDLPFIPPELRENSGEIEAAEQDILPLLIRLEDIQGIFHVHTDFIEKGFFIEPMVIFSAGRDLHCDQNGFPFKGG